MHDERLVELGQRVRARAPERDLPERRAVERGQRNGQVRERRTRSDRVGLRDGFEAPGPRTGRDLGHASRRVRKFACVLDDQLEHLRDRLASVNGEGRVREQRRQPSNDSRVVSLLTLGFAELDEPAPNHLVRGERFGEKVSSTIDVFVELVRTQGVQRVAEGVVMRGRELEDADLELEGATAELVRLSKRRLAGRAHVPVQSASVRAGE
jgi:hypothetical protein